MELYVYNSILAGHSNPSAYPYYIPSPVPFRPSLYFPSIHTPPHLSYLKAWLSAAQIREIISISLLWVTTS